MYVSVPTRGLLITNQKMKVSKNYEYSKVSVPTRGLLIPNIMKVYTKQYMIDKFPSPQGVS